MVALPLRLRIPNPPAIFVGRDGDVEWLRQATHRAPLTLVNGPAGIGKSALARVVASELHCIHVRCEGDPWRSVARALAEAHSIDVAWGELQDRDALMALTLDLAERGEPLHVLVEDLHEVAKEDATSWLGTVARYGRDARFIATSRRSDERSFLLGQQRVLAALDPSSLEQLARHARPEARPTQIREWIEIAQGSPQRLLHATHGIRPEDPWGDLNEAARAALILIGSFDAVVPSDAVCSDGVEPLVTCGLVVRSPRGLRAHASAPRGEADPNELERLAALLRSGADPEASLAGMRRIGVDESAAFRVLHTGYARELWPLLSNASWHLRAATALELGTPAAIDSIPNPDGQVERVDDDTRLLWARVVSAAGRNEEARGMLDSLAEVNDEAQCIRALIDMGEGRFELALAGLEETTSRHALGLRAGCHAALGNEPGARQALERAEAHADEGTLNGELSTAQTYYLLGDVLAAARTLRMMFERAPTVLSEGRGRWAVALDAIVKLDRADVSGARVALENTKRYAGDHPVLCATVAIGEIGLSMLVGDLDGLRERLDSIHAELVDLTEHASMVSAQRVALGVLRADKAPEPLTPGTTGSQQLHAILVALARARFGVVEATPTVSHPEPMLVASLVEATRTLIGGEASRAATSAIAIARKAESLGYGVRALEAWALAEEALLVAGSDASNARSKLSERPDTRFGRHGPVWRRRRDPDAPKDAVDDLIATVPSHAWTIDRSLLQVTLPGPVTVDLSTRRVLWAILESLCTRGGQATKEQLVKDVWEVNEYHPLRHDNRLQSAIRKLRKMLGEEPARLVTRDDGYALAGSPHVIDA